MNTDTTERLPDGWKWDRVETDRIVLGRTGGPSLIGERDARDEWRVMYRTEREGAVFVDALGDVPEQQDPRAVLADAARHAERHDVPENHLGELVVVEDGTIRCREWRIQ